MQTENLLFIRYVYSYAQHRWNFVVQWLVLICITEVLVSSQVFSTGYPKFSIVFLNEAMQSWDTEYFIVNQKCFLLYPNR